MGRENAGLPYLNRGRVGDRRGQWRRDHGHATTPTALGRVPSRGTTTQPQGRNDEPKPSSLFEWALCAEQERKKGLAGAGRWANRRRGDAAMRRPLVGCPCVRPFCVSGRRRLRVRAFLVGGFHHEKPVEVAHPKRLLNPPAGVRRGTALAGHQQGVVGRGQPAPLCQFGLGRVEQAEQLRDGGLEPVYLPGPPAVITNSSDSILPSLAQMAPRRHSP